MTKEEKLKKIIGTERAKAEGYKQISEIYGAYIAVLLKRLGASKENGITINGEEVSEALKKYEVRAFPADEGKWSLYCEVIDK